jgi:hypothetical protein
MRKLVITIVLFIGIMSTIQAQDYSTGIGLRGGLYNGITLKHFLGNKLAVEGILVTRWGGFEITGLGEVHSRAFDVDSLNWYWGIGGHIVFWNGDKTSWGEAGTTYTAIGVDGILGLEYSFSDFPINLGIDWKPSMNLIGYSGFWADAGAFSIRYIF